MPNDELNRSLGRVEGKLDQLIDQIGRHLDADDGIHVDHAERISKLERGRSYIIGATAVVSGVVTLFGSEIVAALKGLLS